MTEAQTTIINAIPQYIIAIAAVVTAIVVVRQAILKEEKQLKESPIDKREYKKDVFWLRVKMLIPTLFLIYTIYAQISESAPIDRYFLFWVILTNMLLGFMIFAYVFAHWRIWLYHKISDAELTSTSRESE